MFTHWVKGGARGTLRVGTWNEDDNREALEGFGGVCDRLPTCAPIGWSAGHDAYVVLVCGGCCCCARDDNTGQKWRTAPWCGDGGVGHAGVAEVEQVAPNLDGCHFAAEREPGNLADSRARTRSGYVSAGADYVRFFFCAGVVGAAQLLCAADDRTGVCVYDASGS